MKKYFYYRFLLGIGDWGLGVWVLGLGAGANGR